MNLRSDSIAAGAAIDARYAAGKPDSLNTVTFSDNLNPHLTWSGAPAQTRSFVVMVHDRDAPSRGDDVNKADREVPVDLPRADFFHWLLIDVPPSVTTIGEGEFSAGVTPHGKPGPDTLHGARHGLNDYTGWFANDDGMKGDFYGYDGPFPPFNDSIAHRYVFTVFAIDVPKLDLPVRFSGHELREALASHVLDLASFEATYSLNKRLTG